MDNNKNQPPAAPVPEIPQGELKMPTENISSPTDATPAPKRHVSPLLVILLISSLALLGVAVVWGNQIIDILMPTVEAPVMTDDTTASTTTPPTAEEEIANIETEAAITEEELIDADNELDAIEAEIEAELQ